MLFLKELQVDPVLVKKVGELSKGFDSAQPDGIQSRVEVLKGLTLICLSGSFFRFYHQSKENRIL